MSIRLPNQPDLDFGDNEVHPDEIDDEAPHIIAQHFEASRSTGILGRTEFCKRELANLDRREIARRIEAIIGFMRREYTMDVATLVYYITVLQEHQEADTEIIK